MADPLQSWRLTDPAFLAAVSDGLQDNADLLQLIQSYQPPSITWNAEQENALRLVDNHRNLFITGEAGTGKSRLVREIIRRSQESDVKFAITASTGIAAVPIGGRTLHSWSGIGLGVEDVDSLVSRIRKFQRNKRGSAYDRWTKTTRLLIDEISMISVAFFEKLDKIGQILRRNDKPFGGMQLILVGDFFQLPPVDRSSRLAGSDSKQAVPNKYLFASPTWLKTVDAVVCLTQIYRQTDAGFIDLLRRARNACLTDDDVKLLRSKMTPNGLPPPPDVNGIVAPLLHPRRKTVDLENIRRLRSIPGRCFRSDRKIMYVSVRKTGGKRVEVVQSIGRADPAVRELAVKLAANLQSASQLNIKIGAPVMLLVNLDQKAGLVNGLRGIVVGIGPTATSTGPVPDPPDEPVDLAANPHAGYDPTAVVQSTSTPRIETVSAAGISSLQLLPSEESFWIRFENSDTPVAIGRYVWKQCLIDAEATKPAETWTEWIAVSAIPILLAAACSIHKSQGQTLTAAHLSIGEAIFEVGQAYVAISRLSNLDGLTLSSFNRNAFRTDPITAEFYELIRNR